MIYILSYVHERVTERVKMNSSVVSAIGMIVMYNNKHVDRKD